MSMANHARSDAASNAPSPDSSKPSDVPGSVADNANENRPLVASALADADRDSSWRLIGFAVTPELESVPPPQAAARSAHDTRSAARAARSVMTVDVGYRRTCLILRPRDP